MRRVSKKKARQAKPRALAVRLALERDLYCQALDLIPGHRCWGELVGHEPLRRTAGGDPLDPDQIIIVCEGFNGEVESNADLAALAREVGLLKSMSTRYENGRLVRRPYTDTPQGGSDADADHPL